MCNAKPALATTDALTATKTGGNWASEKVNFMHFRAKIFLFGQTSYAVRYKELFDVFGKKVTHEGYQFW